MPIFNPPLRGMLAQFLIYLSKMFLFFVFSTFKYLKQWGLNTKSYVTTKKYSFKILIMYKTWNLVYGVRLMTSNRFITIFKMRLFP